MLVYKSISDPNAPDVFLCMWLCCGNAKCISGMLFVQFASTSRGVNPLHILVALRVLKGETSDLRGGSGN
jgi:hypothetical protein